VTTNFEIYAGQLVLLG